MYDENSLRSRAVVWLLVAGAVVIYGSIATAFVLTLVKLWPAISKILGGG